MCPRLLLLPPPSKGSLLHSLPWTSHQPLLPQPSQCGRQGFKGRQFDGAAKDSSDKGKSKDVRCYNCQGFGHMARDCSKPHVPKGRK